MKPIAVISAPLSTDLSPLTQHLWAKRIVHRVVEEVPTETSPGEQILLIANPNDLPKIEELLQQWRDGTLAAPSGVSSQGKRDLIQRARQVPLTLGIILALAAIFFWQQVSNDWLSWLQQGQTLWPDFRNNLATYQALGIWGLWRPTILHFSAVHLLMNLLWIWILAGAIERQKEYVALVSLFILCGLAGNLLQWWIAGPAFGGVSGVVYGLTAWIGLRQARYHVPYGVPSAILGIMVFFMVLTIAGDSLVPGMSGIANGGHLGGLLCGFLLAILWPVSFKADLSK
ncbi:MAG: rhomboid family intramembrane serine protease [Oleibacter sp.]|nr:rhomboid family intramembrane serine protease [Thalassolituus sp.]